MTTQALTGVPLTPMMTRYRAAKAGGATGLHRELAAGIPALAAAIAADFAESVAQMNRDFVMTPDEPFRPERRAPGGLAAEVVDADAEAGTDALEVRRAHDVAVSLARTTVGTLHVDGHKELDARYVDYEVSVLRKSGAAMFTDGSPAGRALVADLLLRSADRFPVLVEVKLRDDTNPVLGVIQALTYAAHLAPEGQYARLSVVPPGDGPSPDRGFRPWASAGPVLDAYVLLIDPQAGAGGKVEELHNAAPELVRALAERPEIRRVVRRLELLQLDLDDRRALGRADGKIVATRRTTLR